MFYKFKIYFGHVDLTSFAWKLKPSISDIEMDARDLFRRLSAGAKFDTNRFMNDALKFKVQSLSNYIM